MGCGVGKAKAVEAAGTNNVVATTAKTNGKRKSLILQPERKKDLKTKHERKRKQTKAKGKTEKKQSITISKPPAVQADDDYTGVATAESELPTVQVTKEPEPEDSCMKTHVSFLNVRSLPISMSPDDFTEDSRRDTGFSGWGFRKEDSFTTQPKLSTVGLSGRPIFAIGQRIKVRDSETEPWKKGIVVQKGFRPLVKLDGLKHNGFRWAFAEPLDASEIDEEVAKPDQSLTL